MVNKDEKDITRMFEHSIVGTSRQGNSHKRSKVKPDKQDAYHKHICSDGTAIIAIADGHGSSSSPFSKEGSNIAVKILVNILKDYHDNYVNQSDALLTFFNREGDTSFAKRIDDIWKQRILSIHNGKKRNNPVKANDEMDFESIYRMYGTTLVGLMITDTFVFLFQLGDGDIALVNDRGASIALKTEKILGTETHSLCKKDAWKEAITSVRRIDDTDIVPFAYILSTDGFSNSFKSENDYEKACFDYFSLIKEYGTVAIKKRIKGWLDETSLHGCGDDITVSICYTEKYRKE